MPSAVASSVEGAVSSWHTVPFAYHHGYWSLTLRIGHTLESRACVQQRWQWSWAERLCVPGEMSRRCVYVGTLPKSTTEEMLKVIFPMANGITMKPADDPNMRWVHSEPMSFVLRPPPCFFDRNTALVDESLLGLVLCSGEVGGRDQAFGC